MTKPNTQIRHMAHAATIPEIVPLGGRGMPRIFARANPTATTVGELHIYGDIGWGGVTESDVAAKLATLKSAKSLSLYLNSPGGDVTAGNAIFNMLQRFNGEVTVHVDGLAASIASIIAMAGDKIITAANALWMIHDPWIGIRGTAGDLRSAAEVLDKVRETLIQTYATRTKADKKKIGEWMAAETWMTAEEAKARGFTDEIASDRVVENVCTSPLLASFRNTPEHLRTQASTNSARLRAAEMDLAEDILKMRNGASPATPREGQPERKEAVKPQPSNPKERT
jgi:ATP-dependent Clp protease protease subunit